MSSSLSSITDRARPSRSLLTETGLDFPSGWPRITENNDSMKDIPLFPSYGDVVDGRADAARRLGTARTRADVMNYLSAASFGVTACEDAFRETPRVRFLSRGTLRKYVSNALAMGDQLSSQW
ncbi:hypothetical protein HPP92_009519 [Vanilla planifolia]|uniref:Uncharacterized protein n=1 Tax=Vanilla planifolia TaxID=51239 RepID=A0A835V6E0_VANPL|nr:hypothetical protein HPP92_009519 [Vanilla planifolia]